MDTKRITNAYIRCGRIANPTERRFEETEEEKEDEA